MCFVFGPCEKLACWTLVSVVEVEPDIKGKHWCTTIFQWIIGQPKISHIANKYFKNRFLCQLLSPKVKKLFVQVGNFCISHCSLFPSCKVTSYCFPASESKTDLFPHAV